MTTYEAISLVIACLSFVVAYLAFNKSSAASEQANSIAAQQLTLAHAQVEIDLRATITESRRNTEAFYNEHGDFLARDKATLSADETKKRERLVTAARSAIEGYLSALDEACQKYIDKKIDKKRFKKSYQREIRQAIQAEGHKDFFSPGHAYNALWRVYEEWENPEKG